MFFSRVRIDNGSLAQVKLLRIFQGDVYAVHRLIWKLFPDDKDAKRDFLFRQEFEKEQITFDQTRCGLPLFYVVSQRKPEDRSGILKVEVKEYLPALKNGMRLMFDLRANPTVQEKIPRNNSEEWINNRRKLELKEKPPTKLRRYHDVLMQAKRNAKMAGIKDSFELQHLLQKAAFEWIVSMGENNGFSIERNGDDHELVISAYQQHLIRKKESHHICFSSIDYNGILKVTDSKKFATALINGLGRSKAFGCGLMLIKPV